MSKAFTEGGRRHRHRKRQPSPGEGFAQRVPRAFKPAVQGGEGEAESPSGFVARFIDPAFNDCIFLWDSCFMTLFGRYGARAFPFIRTLDNFYAKQHPDGFICREIGRAQGDDRFPRFDPSSTGPNVLAWAEWEHYRNFGDADRLARVFPVLRAYHQWLRAYRTWPDGTYWSTGWGSGMDNQPRVPTGTPYSDPERYHGRMTWVDVSLQQLLSARLLRRGRGNCWGRIRSSRQTGRAFLGLDRSALPRRSPAGSP